MTPQLTAALRQIARTAPPVPFTPSEMAAAEELPVHQVKLPGAATALAASADGLFGVGTDTGKVLVFDGGGAVQWEAEFSGPVSALAAIPGGNGETRWAVGEIPAEASDTGKLHLLSGSGERQWSADTSPYQGRNGTIRTIFPAQFALNSLPVVVAGDDGWHYRAFDWNGKELWKRQIYHGATVGVAADLTGDRLDEIVAGSEYYYHQLLDRNGKVLIQKNTDPFTLAIGIIDLDSDGRAEALCGRSDGKIHVMAPTEERIGQFSALPVGGQPVGIVPCRSTGGGLFAVATANGRLVFGDARMQAVNSVQFDCGFYGLIRQQDVLLLPATDGYVYRADFSGRITGRYRCGYDPGQVSPPRPVSAGETAAAAAGDTLYLLK